ncbi:GrpB family protein [Priestia filamentosa]|uniref:GrpB family protein n=1 Tax=Priestia filamentosa TaxID=1402861 RepID=UPI001FB53C49|nr:GrpB family protein [Priestia filamentosa]MED3728661.1 GrpB family protein [Priestia filamentosa]UOE58629.1 GrpB family protein [Priestia filamentosa]
MRKTELYSWTEQWGALYEQEKELLHEILKDNVIHMFHIGSTSVHTIPYAKPIIDILVVVSNIERIASYEKEMIGVGYSAKGENGITGRRYFVKGKEKRTHHVHIFQSGHAHIEQLLDFKKYLLHHPLEARAYGELKRKLAREFPDFHYQYQEGKREFVTALAHKASLWGEERRRREVK